MQQFDILAGIPPLPPREIGEACAKQCLENAEALANFDAEGARKFIHGWVIRHGSTSGEDLVDAAMAHGYRGHDARCFGAVFSRLVRENKLMVLRSDLPRKRGHGTSGGRLYGVVR